MMGARESGGCCTGPDSQGNEWHSRDFLRWLGPPPSMKQTYRVQCSCEHSAMRMCGRRSSLRHCTGRCGSLRQGWGSAFGPEERFHCPVFPAGRAFARALNMHAGRSPRRGRSRGSSPLELNAEALSAARGSPAQPVVDVAVSKSGIFEKMGFWLLGVGGCGCGGA